MAVFFAACIAACVLALGGSATQLGPWYYSLAQPGWKPPDWLFGPAWTTIFLLTSLSIALGWRHLDEENDRRRLIGMFFMNAMLNVWWSVLFFGLHRPDWALYEVGFLWLSILVPLVFLWRVSKLASLLLVPYLGWVTFAAVLNWSVVQLNAPF